MLLQRRPDGAVRLFAQHHHALICGDMARAWRGPGQGDERLPFETILAIGLHDYAWFTDDRYALLDSRSGRPLDFIAYPMGRRLSLYTDGVDALERLHPYSAFLVSLHYSTFQGMEAQQVFQSDEAARRRRLDAGLTEAQREPRRQEHELELLKLFDILSLYVCMSPPSADRSWLPGWLDPARFGIFPDGASFELSWVADDVLRLEPSPWSSPFEVVLPYRELPKGIFTTQSDLDLAFSSAPTERWVLTFDA